MSKSTIGNCLCGDVSFEITGNIGIFQYCHCSRCRKVTGSAFAANLFTSLEDFSWIKGETKVERYSPEDTKYFSTAFCKQCGSSLPWFSKNGKIVVIPAGTLEDHPGVTPTQNIFCGSQAKWYTSPSDLPKHEELPSRK